MMRVLFVRDVSTRNENLSLFSAATSLSLSLTKFFFFLLAAVEKKDRPANRRKRTKIKKEPLSFVSEKVILAFEIFAFFLSVVVSV